MHNQHAGLSQLVAHQHIQDLQERAAQSRLADGGGRSRRQRHRWSARRWWRLARWPAAATLAAMTLAAMATAANANQQPAGPEGIPRPPTERQVGEPWRQRQAAPQNQAANDQAAADAALQRQLARERFSIPDAAPAQTPAPVPAKPSRQPGWLIASLAVLVAGLALGGGLAVVAGKRTRRQARLEHAA